MRDWATNCGAQRLAHACIMQATAQSKSSVSCLPLQLMRMMDLRRSHGQPSGCRWDGRDGDRRIAGKPSKRVLPLLLLALTSTYIYIYICCMYVHCTSISNPSCFSRYLAAHHTTLPYTLAYTKPLSCTTPSVHTFYLGINTTQPDNTPDLIHSPRYYLYTYTSLSTLV